MYLLYTLPQPRRCSSALAPYFAYQARAVPEVRREPAAAARLPARVVQRRRRRVDLDPRGLGRRGAHRAARSPADLKARYPRLRLFVSTTTMAGQQVARGRSRRPTPSSTSRSTSASSSAARCGSCSPRLFVMMETEIWPNLLRECRRAGVQTVIVNGRISTRSYPRYRLRPAVLPPRAGRHRPLLHAVEESAAGSIDLGADPARVRVTGSLKFDSLPAAPAAPERGGPRVLRFFRVPAGRPVIVAGSTMRGEELIVLRAFERAARERRAAAAGPRAAPPRAVRRGRAAGARGRVSRRRGARQLDDRRGAAGRRRRARHDRRAGAALPHGDGRVRRRQPRADGRAQHPRAGGLRQADRLRPAHAELPRDRRDVPRPRGAAVQVRDERELEEALRDLLSRRRRGASALGAAARALVDANHGARERTLAAIARAAAGRGDGRSVRPFRAGEVGR